ncbi:type I restriction endonuclease subunit R [Clostridium botulinum]|uniref:type I restriction endonuclease subunit R n=1 Tax=Clostridium botulinum TaxID=1491 RepID=UPI000A177EC6|nr:type I restriction endonuclease [Clostridium botulinum]MBY6836771.1 type I restriction endonuclease subunit R [Clostridium botulinum]NFG65937.1 type I restriction endonuclease subunit R [Clostridium botulinum]NFQ25567.1 type I restriction endonuclease subunit R [Clostridium botulinum]
MNEEELKEKAFEEAIEEYLITKGGYIKGNPKNFNRELALDNDTLIKFIKKTQPKKWERYVTIYGSASEESFIKRFNKEVRINGLLAILRRGFKDRGIKFDVAYFKPANTDNTERVKLYDDNILHCTRQLHYSVFNENSIDIVLFLNGIPVVSMELKCQFTGQTIHNAINQYKFDRASKDTIFDFRNRVLVHFAVDLFEVHMTTRLNGENTYFLPFNQGSNGSGNVGGAGNPLNPDGYQTAYLWEKVLCKDRLMEILHKYMHLKKEDKKDEDGKVIETTEALIFPRYHQLDVVTKLLEDVKANGAGKNYLIQHSAGSGKSNSIAWLAHRLSGLHDDNNNPIYKSIIVVTDRRVLDSQLQDTIYQFDHVLGVVECIDKKKHAVDLRDAINAGKRIIITTLQKFPVIYKEVQTDGNFAIIVDEAHSSQTGEASKKLKKALANTEDILEEYRVMEDEAEENVKDDEDKMLDELASHGRIDNLSFFAFTATPKEKTLQMFGDKQTDGTYRAFHIYSMRQAIEEHFILDILKNYTTYKMYYKIAKKVADDPDVDASKGAKEIARYESLHPHNLAQKTAIMIEHFRNITKNKIGGKAKAMVVTASRLHAVRYLFEFRRYIKEKGYTDLDVLVAFSGTVNDPDIPDTDFTEEGLNKDKKGNTIKEDSLKEEFHGDAFNMLIVAEKYQTGFDEPLLHTMFVDKKLSGVKAVQTLSRLNRTMKGKEDTFVLDFVNSAEEMQKSFQPYYEATVLEQETDPNVIYDLKNGLDSFQIYQPTEVEHFANIFYGKDNKNAQALLTGCIKPALDRYNAKEDKEREEFKSSLATFVRIYSFIIQVCRMYDKDMQKFFVYARFLSKCLPKGENVKIDLSDKLMLEYYRLDKTFSGDILLEKSEGYVANIKGGIGGKEKKEDSLSVIIDKMNDRFGTAFTEQDKVLEQMKSDFAKDEKIVNAVKADDKSLFKYLYEQKFKDVAVNRYEENDKFFMSLFSDEEKMNFIMNMMSEVIFNKLKK